jgi:hypothetical protein
MQRALRHGLVLLAAATILPAFAAAPAAKMIYDGSWSVVIVTQEGPCDRAYSYPISIANGRVAYAGQGSFKIRGAVAGNGAVSVSVSFGEARADGAGRLSPSGGTGTWKGASATSACSGTWTAERR